MKTIHKYPIYQTVFPKTMRVIHVGLQNSNIFLWVEFDDEPQRKEERFYSYYGTGTTINSELVHVGTVFEDMDRFVWHVYEDIKMRKDIV